MYHLSIAANILEQATQSLLYRAQHFRKLCASLYHCCLLQADRLWSRPVHFHFLISQSAWHRVGAQ